MPKKSGVGPWAKDKLDRLGKYLHVYTTIMRKQDWCEGFFYIDAFAGPGEQEVRRDTSNSEVEQGLLDLGQAVSDDRQYQEFVSGSPLVALKLKHPFTGYVFIDKSMKRTAALEELAATYPDRNIRIRREDCNSYLQSRVAANAQIDWTVNRAVVFLDPFGMQVEWNTIAALGATGAIEVFLNFPVGMAIQRLLLRRGNFTDKQRTRLDAYFGSPDWFDAVYVQPKSLFTETDVDKVEKSGQSLVR